MVAYSPKRQYVTCRVACCRQCVLLVEQIVAKQTDINADMLRKVSMLQKLIRTKLIDHHHYQQANQQQQQQQHWWLSNDQPQDGQRMHDDALPLALPSPYRM